MTDDTLSRSRRLLLQRWFDGELAGDDRDRAKQIAERSRAARRYLEGLEQLRATTRAAFDEAHRPVEERFDAEDIAARAGSAPALADLPLAELAPALERLHDGEVTEPEEMALRDLRARREDVDTYLDDLEHLGDAVRTADRIARSDVPSGAIWESIEGELASFDSRDEATEGASYEPSKHDALLHRYVDGEASPLERQRVEAWRARGLEPVETRLRVLHELRAAAEMASEVSRDEVDFGAWRAELDETLDDASDEPGGERAGFVALEKQRSEGSRESSDGGPAVRSSIEGDASHDSTHLTSWLWHHRRRVAGVAAAACLAITASVVGGYLSLSSRSASSDEDSVVIVDSVTHEGGGSVLVDGDETGGSESNADGTSNEEGSSRPTVIWLLGDKQENSPESTTPAREQSDANSR